MKFSIILPAYNRQDYLDEALESVLAQTLSDWECIVIDDASPDVVLSVPDDPRIQIIRNPVNRGIPGTRNVGLSRAQGDKVCFLDHDDRYTPDRLAIAQRPVPVLLLLPLDRQLSGNVTSRILSGFTPHLGVVTVDRTLCPEFDEDFKVSDDVDWWLRLAQAQPFATEPGNCYIFRRHAWSDETGRAARLADAHLLMNKHAEYFAANRRARAFRWARVAALADNRRDAMLALARSGMAYPSRYAVAQAVDILGRTAKESHAASSPIIRAARRRICNSNAFHDPIHTLHRHGQELLDQIATRCYHRLGPLDDATPFDGDPRLAVVTVNFSTTRFLKLMLCTLADQSELWFVQRLIVVDNDSRDGGVQFLRELDARVPRFHLVERRHFLSHAAGMRAGIRAVDCIDQGLTPEERVNLILLCDPDVVFRDPSTLRDVSAAIVQTNGALAGEVRRKGSGHPDIQASFFAVRRDILARRDVQPFVNHGSPAYGMQASVLRLGLTIVDFPSNHGGYVLHRGRTAVAAATTYGVGSYAGVANRHPHFMGVANGARIWASIEQQWAHLLDEDAEPMLLDHLMSRFAVLGSAYAPLF
jgi:glycosyltransferase involved in cell wall biosynthesis